MVLLNSSSCNFGWKPKNFEFTGLKGNKNSLYDMTGLNGILIMFICNHCPYVCLLYTSPSPRDKRQSRMPSSA